MNFTPLRYPGGKAKIYNQICKIISDNFVDPPVYCEPFAGGFGLGMKLLLTGKVSKVYLNDLDYAIYCFWDSIIRNTDEFLTLIDETPITVEEWYHQKQIYLADKEEVTKLQKGFATFFLNRSNRSGILKAGPIGGYTQAGDYRLDCRFRKENLKKVIKSIAKNKKSIHVSNLDCKIFLKRIDKKEANAFIFLDPPYVVHGKELYKNAFVEEDHKKLFKTIRTLKNKWFITYDDANLIKDLYKNFRIDKFDIAYTVQTKKTSSELAIKSNNLV